MHLVYKMLYYVRLVLIKKLAFHSKHYIPYTSFNFLRQVGKVAWLRKICGK